MKPTILLVALAACGDDGGHHVADGPLAIDAPSALDAAPDAAACGGANLQTDPANCGACGHVCGCGATTCTAGACDAATLADGEGGAVAITVASGKLYWGDDVDIAMRTLDLATPGSGATTLFGGRTAIRGIAIADRVYFSRTNFNIMESGALDGSTSGNFTNAQESGAWGVVTTDSAVYWTTRNTGNLRTAARGAPVKPASTIASGLASPAGLAVDATNLYWVENTATGRVLKLALADATPGATPIELATGQDQPLAIVSDGAYVYWTSTGDGTVKRVAVAGTGGTIQTIATGQGQPTGLAIDAANLYWTDTTDGTVARVALADLGSATPPTPTILATGETAPQDLASDGTCVYWADYGDGSAHHGAIRAHER